MKKWIGAMFLMTLMQTASAQDFKKVETGLLINNFENAKTEYEKAVAKKPSLETTAEGYYWKSKIYAGLSKDPAAKYPDASEKLLKSLENYIKADPEYVFAVKSGQEPFFDVYIKSFKDGVAAFGEKKWKDAAANFDRAVFISDIIFSKGWSSNKQPFDTTTLMYAGYSNQNAGNEDITIKYYTRMMDANMKTADVIDMYKYVLIKAAEKKNKALFDQYYAVSEKNYPEEKWFEYRAEYIDKNLTIEEKVAAYEAQVTANSINETESQMYGDMFMSARNADGLPDDKANYFLDKAADAYMRAYKLNTTNFAAAFNVGISYYNQYMVLDDQFGNNIRSLQQLNTNKPVAPKDPKKKLAFDASFKAQLDSIKKLNAALDAPMRAKVDQAIEWIENAFNIIKDKTTLNRTEKNVAARSVDFLATLYGAKRDKNRANQKLYDELDAKFTKYDLLHDKYQ
jgi:tetratricopeptide (TPR) repeat protein